MIYYSDISFTTEEKNYRISKLINEIFGYYMTNMKDDYIDIVNIDNEIMVNDLKNLINFLVTELLPFTRWSSESEAIRYSTNKKLVEWFATYPLEMSLIRTRNSKISVSRMCQIYKNIKFSDTDLFDEMIIDYFTGYQKFKTRLAYKHFIPGVAYPDYNYLNRDNIYHDIMKFFISQFKTFLNFFSDFIIKAPNKDPNNLENFVPLDPDTALVASYVSEFGYPDPEKWMSRFSFSFDCESASTKKLIPDAKKKYRIWMIQEALKYCIDKMPNRIKYKTKPKKYRNKELRKAIIDSMYVHGVSFNMKKTNEVKTTISHVLDKYYDNYPIPCKMPYETYKDLATMIIDSRDEYCDILLAKWDKLRPILNEYRGSYNGKVNYPTALIKIAKEIILMTSMLDMISRCQYSLMLNFDSNKDILYANSIFFSRHNNDVLDAFFKSSKGCLYDLNEHPVLKHLIQDGIRLTMVEMIPRKTIKKLFSDIQALKYHIFKRPWIDREINPDNPSEDDLAIIKRCAVMITLYMIRSMGGHIERASITYTVDGKKRDIIAPLFGRLES